MKDLVKEEEEKAEERTKQKELEYAEAREKAKKERELKKQEALARVQAKKEQDPEYLKKRTEIQNIAAPEVPLSTVEAEEEEEGVSGSVSAAPSDDDVFRSYKPTGRSRIFVK
jgi:hypothetical protein